jgi:hypothetical protein
LFDLPELPLAAIPKAAAGTSNAKKTLAADLAVSEKLSDIFKQKAE